MARPNTLVFVDLPSDDPAAAAAFYAKVFGWTDEPRLPGRFHHISPGGQLKDADGRDTTAANLSIGAFDARNARPHPSPIGVPPRKIGGDVRRPRVWILLGEGQSEAVILDRAVKLGGSVLWRDHYWKEFNGFSCAFADPWGNEFILWSRGGPDPRVPAGFTTE